MIKEDRFVERSHNKFFQMGKDFVEVCPKCKSKNISIRRRRTPRYYCIACKNEFDDPKTMLPDTTKKQQKEIGNQYYNPDE